jgi:hypothetical protein
VLSFTTFVPNTYTLYLYFFGTYAYVMILTVFFKFSVGPIGSNHVFVKVLFSFSADSADSADVRYESEHKKGQFEPAEVGKIAKKHFSASQ